MFVSGGPLYLMYFGLCVLVVMSGMIYLLHFIFISLVLFFCLVCTTNDRKGRKVFCHKKFLLQITMLKFRILKKSSPNRLLVKCRLTVDRQLTDSLPTDQFDRTIKVRL